MGTTGTRFFNIPNTLTLLRLPLAALLWSIRKSRFWTFALMVLAGITDILDGWSARRPRTHQHPAGVWLDPLCDKIFVLSAIAAIYSSRRPPRFAPFLIISRELLQSGLIPLYIMNTVATRHGYYPQHINLKAAAPGKIATFSQFLAMTAMLLDSRWLVPLAVTSGALGSGATVYYIRRMLPALKARAA